MTTPVSAQSGITLVIGGDGKVGRALAEQISRAGQPVITTSRRAVSEQGALFLDLADNVGDWPIPAGVATAIVCAAVPLMDACEVDPAGTARVNVAGTLGLIRRLVERGIFTVFISTNQVFDGSIPHVPPDTPQSPCSEYGRQKTRVEVELTRLGGPIAIVRFAKIIEPGMPLFARWRDALRTGQAITPFVDLRMAPVPLATAVSALRLIADRRAAGLWQVSGERDVTYAEAASMLAARLGAEGDLVHPISARDSGRITAHLPAHTTLSVERLVGEFGLQPPAVEWTLERSFRSIEV